MTPVPGQTAPGRPLARITNWLFRNRETGKITIAQAPNLPLWLFISTVIARALVRHDPANAVLNGLGLAALAWWAIDEVVRGVNPWRRILGVSGSIFVIIAAVPLARR
jgi:hypothetical protein